MMSVYDLPAPKKEDLIRYHALKKHIEASIKQNGGYLSFASFMQMALYYPDLGYYNATTIPIGPYGDFITAPEISPLFAQCVAHQLQEIISQLNGCDILELGAGTGHFASDVIQFLTQTNSLPTHYYIYEISQPLRKQQEDYLKEHCSHFFSRIKWLDQLPNHLKGIIIANEVLDALPVHCFQLDREDIKERCVAIDNDQFVWQLQPPTQALKKAVECLRERYDLKPSYQSEINLMLASFVQDLANLLDEGIMLLIDYGYGEKEYYHPERNRGTLTCFYQHHHHERLLDFPGLQDISAHVDFTRVEERAEEYGLKLSGFTSQAGFLLDLGLMEFAEKAANQLSARDEFHLHQAIKTLTLPTEMGERVKVMALSKNTDLSLSGFRSQDRRRDLSW